MFKTRRFRIRLEVIVIFLAILCAKFDNCVTNDIITTTKSIGYTDITEKKFQFETTTTENELKSSTNSDYDGVVTDLSTEVEKFNLSVDSRDFVTDTFSGGTTEGDESTTVFTTEEITTQSPCQTDPEKLKDIKISHHKANIYALNWRKPTNQECNKYQISVNGVAKKIIDTNSIELDNISSLYCTQVHISAVDVMNNIGNAVTRQIPGKIRNLQAVPESYQINLTWDAPEDTSCVDMYYIYLNDKKYMESANTTATLTNVEACTSHTVRVTSVSLADGTEVESEGESTVVKTTKPQELTKKVENLLLTTELTTLTATWDPPEYTAACIYQYTIRMWGENFPTKDYVTQNEFYEIKPVAPCAEYTFMIYPQLSQSINGNDWSETFNVKAQVTSPPDIKNQVIEKTNINLSVKLTEYNQNICKISSIEATCTFSGENLLPWMIEKVSKSFEYTDSTNRPIKDIVIDKLSAYTDYSCEISVANSAGTSEPVKINAKTNEDVPSEPKNLKTTLNEDDNIEITWDEPLTIPGILKDYKLYVKYKESKHFISKSCEFNKGDVETSVNENNYLLETFLPNSIYSVIIQAQTGAGFGKEALIDFETNPKISNEVRNLDTSIKVNSNDEIYDVTIKIVWELPCNTNGNLIKFKYSIDGVRKENEEALESVTGEIPPNENIENENYSFEFEDVQPWVKYTIKVYAVTKGIEINKNIKDINELDGEIATIEIISPEGRPSEPKNLKTTSNEDDKIEISWDEPSSIHGNLKDYKLYVKYKESNHFISKSCEFNKGDVETSVDGNNYLLQTFVPNSIYSVIVQAQTGAGFGKEASIDFETNPSISNEVRNLDTSIKVNSNDEIYDVAIKIIWELPCNTNGNLIKFKYSIDGVRMENEEALESITGEILPNENIENENYSFEFEDVQPWVEYTIKVYAVTKGIEVNKNIREINELDGEIATNKIISPEGRPSAPQNVTVHILTPTSASISWEEPNHKNGKIAGYQINIDSIKPLHEVSDFECSTIHHDSVDVNEEYLSYEYYQFRPNYEYSLSVKAKTEFGYGEAEKPIFQTLTAPSETVRRVLFSITIKESDDYNVTLTVDFTEPCNLNGKLDFYKFKINGTRSNFEDHVEELNDKTTSFSVSLKPEYTYDGFIEVYTEETEFVSDKTYLDTLESSAGIPNTVISPISKPTSMEPESIKFELSRDTFSNEMGEIIYYAIILAPGDYNPETNYGITKGNWADTGSWNKDGELKEYQTTPKEWNPFKNGSKRNTNSVYTVSIGTENCNESNEEYCNGPLRPDTSYSLRIRGFTSYGYRDTPKIIFLTPSYLNYGALIGGIVGGAVGLIIIFIIIIIFWRRRKTKNEIEDTALDTLPLVPQPIPINKFVEHYNDYKNNLNKLKIEYTLLERMGVSEQLPMTFAMTDDNKRKNRYINVLPYDETRVKLDRDKNDNYTDYINASFIKGYSGNVEYIATQGPLESTVVDFWRMVIQENVAVIVMVAQFVEHEKVKCHQYFPKNHESMTIGDGIEIRCANEVPLGGYIKRTLMVQRELMQITITHLQYIEWPDFGCPNDAGSMLDFCNTLRQCVEQYKSKTIIHCSAGVGRTGTLIALDILLQTIENAGDIDIFKTVLNLRKQRVRMVQTEKQYMYIHNCLAEHISNPRKGESKETEPIYENIVKKTEAEESIKNIP